MDPISMMMGVTSLVGAGMSIFGGMEAAGAQKAIAGAEGQIAGSEMAINAQRHQEMMLTAQRQQMQIVRNAQMARSMSLSGAVNQGAQFGTGLAGGQSQIGGQASMQQLGLNQNLEIAGNIFDQQNKISGLRMNIASLGGTVAEGKGIQSLGSGIASSAGPMSHIFGNLFPSIFDQGGGE